jgi:alcohol dehydrogenase class IV
VVAVGGGSVIDVAKAIAALGRSHEPVSEFHGGRSLDEPGLPVIAIPTTSGTGAEVTPNSVLTDIATNVKASIRGDALLPEVAIVDPELTLTLPPDQTAYSGLDALCQAMEAFVSNIANAVSDALALDACVRIGRSLERAVTDGADIEARSDMALGSLCAGYALASARLGLVHGLAHPLGTLCSKPHGLVCGLLLGPVIRANARYAAERYAVIARALGIPSGATDEASAMALADWVEASCERTGVPTRLSALGVEPQHVPDLAAAGAVAGSTRFNPRRVTEEDLRDLIGAWL